MQSIDRAVAILDVLSEHEKGLPISDITARLGLPLGTVHRFLAALTDNALVVQDPTTKCYRLGWRVLSLASRMVSSSHLIEVSRLHMERMAASLDKMVFLCQEHHGDVVCVACATNPGALHMKFYVQLGSVMPFHASASAKMLLCYQPWATTERLVAHKAPLCRYTERTLTTPDAVRADYALCRQRGYALCDEEMENGVQAAAAPVFGFDRTLVASVGIIGLKAHDVSLHDLAVHAKACAEAISRDVGYTPVGA